MIFLLCLQYKHEISILDGQIQRWVLKHSWVAYSTVFAQKEVKDHIENYTIEIMRGKETKFLRDQVVHDGGYAYKWQHNTQPRRFTNGNYFVPQTIDNVVSNLSSASSISSSQSTIYNDLSEDRVPEKRKKRDHDTQSLESFKRILE